MTKKYVIGTHGSAKLVCMIKSQDREFRGGNMPIKTQTCLHDQKPRPRIPGRENAFKNTNLCIGISHISGVASIEAMRQLPH